MFAIGWFDPFVSQLCVHLCTDQIVTHKIIQGGTYPVLSLIAPYPSPLSFSLKIFR